MYDIPVLINWSLTPRCNLNCGFCFRYFDPELTENETDKIIEKVIKSEVKRITLSGGEPTLVDRLINIADRFHSAGLFVSLHTNGMQARFIEDNYSHFDRISLSLDGPNAKINTLMRGCDKYFETIKNLMFFLLEKSCDFVIKTVVTKKNIQYIPQMVGLIEAVKPVFWSIFEFIPLGIGEINKDEFLLEQGEFLELITNLKCSTKLNTMSKEEADNYPMFCVGANGNVYTKNEGKDNILIASLLDDNITIEQIWRKIIQKNEIKEKYVDKWNIIQKTNT